MSPRALLAEMSGLLTGAAFVFGLCVGSFLNVCVWRLPRGESIVSPGSHCPKCGHTIRAWENVPLLSWLILRARCRSCGQQISWRYPLVELAAGVLFVVVWLRVWSRPLPLSALPAYFFLTAALLAVALIDIEHLLIPNEITYTGFAAALGLALLLPSSHGSPWATGLAAGEHRLLRWGLESLARVVPFRMVAQPRVTAVLDVLLGIAVGYGLLWVVLEVGKRVWGRRVYRPEQPQTAVLTNTGVRIGDDYAAAWDDILFRPTDRFSMICTEVRGGPEKVDLGTGNDAGELSVSAVGVAVGARRWPWSELPQISAMVTRWTVPREVLGFGDLKLLALIGAFLGADACVFVLMFASVAGTVIGVGIVLLKPARRHAVIPFGPFLAGAAFVWMLFGRDLLLWYGRLLGRLGC